MNLRRALEVLNEMKADQVIGEFAVGGAVAANIWIEPSSTYDLDIFITWEPGAGGILTLEPIYDYLRGRGYDFEKDAMEVERDTMEVEGWPIQFITPGTDLVIDALAKAVVVDIDGAKVRFFTQEHLMAICLETGRPKDRARLVQFVEEAKYDVTKFDDLLTQYGLQGRWRAFRAVFPFPS